MLMKIINMFCIYFFLFSHFIFLNFALVKIYCFLRISIEDAIIFHFGCHFCLFSNSIYPLCVATGAVPCCCYNKTPTLLCNFFSF